MLFRLLLLFTLVPLIELALLLWVGSVTSVQFTILLVLVTGVVGAALARWQGWQTWSRIQNQFSQGQIPSDALMDGLMILIAGALLITPGILTDIVGFSLLIPQLRTVFKRSLLAWFKTRTHVRFHTYRRGDYSYHYQTQTADDSVIDAEFVRHTDEDDSRAHLD